MLRVVKTTAGSNGAPSECSKCVAKDFKKSGLGWACMGCGNYHASPLNALSLEDIHQHLEREKKKAVHQVY